MTFDYLTLDIAQKVGSVIASFSIVIASAAYLFQRHSLRLQHERARREKAVSIVSDFAASLTPNWSAARKLARRLTNHEIDCLDQAQPLSIARDLGDLLITAIPESVPQEQISADGATIQLSQRQSYALRWEMISRLNTSEAVAQSWLMDVAYRPTIETELRFLLDPENGQNILTSFRTIAGQKEFPALHALINRLEGIRDMPHTPEPLLDQNKKWWQIWK